MKLLFNFVNEKLDGRSIFANLICKSIYKLHNGDIDTAIKNKETIKIFDGLEDNVKNIYELIEFEIPLFAYYRLLKYKASNWDMDKKEYTKAINNTKQACIDFYGTRDTNKTYSKEDLIMYLKAFHLDSVQGQYSIELLEWCNKWIDDNLNQV